MYFSISQSKLIHLFSSGHSNQFIFLSFMAQVNMLQLFQIKIFLVNIFLTHIDNDQENTNFVQIFQIVVTVKAEL